MLILSQVRLIQEKMKSTTFYNSKNTLFSNFDKSIDMKLLLTEAIIYKLFKINTDVSPSTCNNNRDMYWTY